MTVHYVVAGNFCVDTVVNPAGERMAQQLGGTAVYGAIGARIWSDAVGISTVVGRDFARQVRTELSRAGIDTTGIREVPRSHGLVWFTGYVSGDDRVEDVEHFAPVGTSTKRERYVFNGSARHRRLWPIFSPGPADMPKAFATASRVHLAPMPLRRLAQNVEWFRARGAGVSVDWPFWYGTSRKVLYRRLLRSVDAVLPSIAELRQFRPDDVQSAVADIGNAGPRIVVVKQGSAGVTVFDLATNVATNVPAYPTVVRDPTGAGDAFCGGFAVGLDETGDPVEAAIFGVVSASFVIEDFGAFHALAVRRHEAESRRTAVRRSIQRSTIRETA